MSKTVNLTIGERVKAMELLNAGKFDTTALAIVLDDIKKIAITSEEWKEANLIKTPSDEDLAKLSDEERADTQVTWKWDERDKEMELGSETVDTLTQMINQKSEARELGVSDGAYLTLLSKLEAE